MKYLSVCSGIEAATVAWHPLGWTPVAFSEIEPFPAAVLAHHYPDVPNYGDMTNHKEWPLEPGSIDLLVGGTPCQAFSVAGLRGGLSDPRGGLMLTYLEIAQRLRPRWIVWENVPGVLSSGGGRDFGSFLGALGELGYGWAYRVLDAQWCRTHGHPRAVPQRRRRVFVVGCLGDSERAAKVLFERESVHRDSAPRRAQGEGAPSDAEAGVGTSSERMSDKDNFGAVVQLATMRSSSIGSFVKDDIAGTMRAQGGDYQGGSESLVLQPVPFTKSKRAQSVTDDETWVDGKVNPTVAFTPGNLARGAGPSPNAEVAPTQRCSAGRGADDQRTCVAMVGTDLYNGAITGDVAATMGTPGSSVNASGPTVMQAHAFYSTGGTHGVNQHPEVSPAVKVGSGLGIPSPPAVAFTRCDNGRDASVEVTPTMRCGSNYSAHPAVAQAMTVRRLTNRECERLQGFPDDYTLIPWRKKPAADCPDGPRYKALGNSMAVNCMAWIGERINMISMRSDQMGGRE